MADQTENKGKRFQGTITSDKMQDSAVVSVTRFEKHPRYKKFVKSVKKIMAHNPGNKFVAGDVVEIEEVKPISKRKRFAIVDKNE